MLEFYRDLTDYASYELETAGVLKGGGRKFWALARSGWRSALKGQDQVNAYLLLATSCDGSLATVATPTSVRVVCNNTLTIAVDGISQGVKVSHSTEFDPKRARSNDYRMGAPPGSAKGPSLKNKALESTLALVA